MPLDDRPGASGDDSGARAILSAMVAFAAGDALGVPWEGSPPDRVDRDLVTRLPASARGWPRGSTSDDTAQMVLVARCLADAEGRPSGAGFLARLAEEAPGIRGIGPTTHRALDHFRATGRPPAPSPRDVPTNGAAMRICPVGWGVPADQHDRRRALVRVFSAPTHTAPEAAGAAYVIAAMAARAVDGASVEEIIGQAAGEVEWVREHCGPMDAVRAALSGRWSPPPGGVPLDAAETVAAVVHVVRAAPALAEALPYAVSLGGDTDTVAALVGGVLGARDPVQVDALGWLGLVNLGEWPGLEDLAARLHALRGIPAV
jgi:ADP-ribosylglycohydrolase